MSSHSILLSDKATLVLRDGRAVLLRVVQDPEPSEAELMDLVALTRKKAGLSIALGGYWLRSGLAWERKVIQSLPAKKER